MLRRYFPLFEGNDDVELIDIDRRLGPGGVRRVVQPHRLPGCARGKPDGAGVQGRPHELFARALGVTGARLKAMDRRPRYIVWTRAEMARRVLCRAGTPRGIVVGVQPRTDEAYRDEPHMGLMVDALAQEHRVLVMGSGWRRRSARAARDLVAGTRPAGGICAGERVRGAGDARFGVLASGQGTGTAVCGLSGRLTGVSAARITRARGSLDARRMLGCVPCWRNEDTSCALTGLGRACAWARSLQRTSSRRARGGGYRGAPDARRGQTADRRRAGGLGIETLHMAVREEPTEA